MPFRSSWDNSKLALIDCGLRLTTRLIDQIGYAGCGIFKRLRLRSTSSFVAPFIMRSVRDFIACSRGLKPYLVSLGILARDV